MIQTYARIPRNRKDYEKMFERLEKEQPVFFEVFWNIVSDPEKDDEYKAGYVNGIISFYSLLASQQDCEDLKNSIG